MLSRRTLLKGAGAALALPYLEAMGQTAPAKRLLIVYNGTGGVPRNPKFPNIFYPATTGSQYAMTDILAPLQRHRDRMMVLGGIDNLAAWKGPLRSTDGGHVSAERCNLTCMPYGGPSIDQVIADQIGGATRLKSLSFNWGYNIIPLWQSAGVRLPVVSNDPCALFESMFGHAANSGGGGAPTGPSYQNQNRKSVLDAVSRSTAALKANLGRTDRQILDGYLETVRAVEQRLAVPAAVSCTEPASLNCDPYDPENLDFMQLIPLALACDVTRVATLLINSDANGLSTLGLPTGSWHDDFEHYAHEDDAITSAVSKWQQWQMTELAKLVDVLQATPEGAGTVFDNTLILFTHEQGHAGNHNQDNVPYVLIGGKAFDSHFRFGEYRKFSGASNNQLFAAVYNSLAPTPISQFGDPQYGQGVLSGLT